MVLDDFLHYSQVPPGTSGEKTIYGKEKKNLEYVYDDRLREWDYAAHEKAREKANKTRTPHTSEWYKKYLSSYYKEPIELCHILIGVNVSNGYDYKVFGFRRKKSFYKLQKKDKIIL